MQINDNLLKKINILDKDKKYVITMLLESIENGTNQTRIEDQLRNEIREVIKEGEQH